MRFFKTLDFIPPTRRKRRCKSRREVVPPIPKAFSFGFTGRRPLVPMSAVSMFLNKSAGEIISLIEDGRLRWVFDIRSAKSRRREVRVLRQSLFEYAGLFPRETVHPEAEKSEFSKIVDLILPKGTVLSPMAFNTLPPKTCTRGARSFHLKLRLPVASVASLRKQLYPQEPVLRGAEIAQCFSCMPQHVLNLISEKTLPTINLRRGPKASPLIPRASVVEFLEKRRMS